MRSSFGFAIYVENLEFEDSKGGWQMDQAVAREPSISSSRKMADACDVGLSRYFNSPAISI